MRRSLVALVGALAMAGSASGQKVECEELVLDNGMTFILCPRHENPNIIAAGWLAKVGSVNEHPGITGISHFFEHMMFKGTNSIGTSDAAQDTKYRADQKRVRDELMEKILTENYARWRAGEIKDPWDPETFTPKMMELRKKLIDLMDEEKQVVVNNEFDQVYTELGASGMNAFTTYDQTFFFINVPANKFELWAWMESDRLGDSVFREFYSERDVVHEERRLRTDSTPTGKYEEEFDAMFWESSPYSWPVIGWPSDLNSYTLEQAKEYYATYYQPENLVGVVVGDFETAEIRPVIQEYFGRLSPSGKNIPPMVTQEVKQLAEKRMIAECDCQPQVEVRYHTVPFGHKDSYALEVLAEILNGRTGRLYKGMVEGKEVASSASAVQTSGAFGAPSKYEGYFAFSAETKGDAEPEQLEAAWYDEIERIKKEPVDAQELQKVKNQSAADSYRRLQNNFFLMIQLGIYENLGDWRLINEQPGRLQAVTAEDITRVANEYFAKENRSVAMYHRQAGSGSAQDTELAAALEGLEPQMAQALKQQIKMLGTVNDAAMLSQALSRMEASSGQAPPEMKNAIDYMIKKVRERIEELNASSEGGDQ